MNIWCGVPFGDSQGHSTWWSLQQACNVLIFSVFGRSTFYICGLFNNEMHLHLSSFNWNAAQTASWSGLSD